MKTKTFKLVHAASLSKVGIGGEIPGEYQLLKTRLWSKAEDFTPISPAELAILTSVRSDFRNIEKIVRDLAEGIKNLQEKPIVYTTYVYDLGNKKYKLKNPINIVIEVYEDEFIAKFPELEIFGSGNTETESILALKEEIITLYVELADSSEKELGRLPQMWRRTLKKLILCR